MAIFGEVPGSGGSLSAWLLVTSKRDPLMKRMTGPLPADHHSFPQEASKTLLGPAPAPKTVCASTVDTRTPNNDSTLPNHLTTILPLLLPMPLLLPLLLLLPTILLPYISTMARLMRSARTAMPNCGRGSLVIP